MTKPIDLIEKEFTLPFPPHKFQKKSLDDLAWNHCALLKYKVGLGKTFTSILAALHSSIVADVEQILVLCPPILIDQWYEFLLTIGGIPDICVYRGKPDERKLLKMEDASIVIVSYNIFRGKRDYARFNKWARSTKLNIIADELSLKSLKSSTFKKLKEVLYRRLRLDVQSKCYHRLIALNATPLSDLMHVYNWCAIMTPGLYRSQKLFTDSHVLEQDHWGEVLEWKDEDLMHRNMNIFSVDTKEVVKLPPLVETVTPYHLSKPHKKLYEEVKNAELMNLPDDKIQLAINSMFSTLQRLILCPREFGLDIESPILEFIEGYLDQLPLFEGVLIYTRHVIVSEMLADAIPDSVAIYGGVKKSVREQAFEDLKSGKVKRLIGNIDSLGAGLNLQMLNHTIYAELPFRDDKLTQTLGRTHRQGQTSSCFASFPLAKGTVQRRIYTRLLKNGEDINKVMKTKDQVRSFLG